MPKKKVKVQKSDLDHLMYLAEKMIRLGKERKKLEEEAAVLNSQYNKLRLETIPEYAKELGATGMTGWTLGDGSEVKIVEDMKVKVPDIRLLDALEYVRKKDKASIIKTSIHMEFDGEDQEKLDLLRALLLKHGFVFDEKPAINGATLKAFLKELRKAGTKDLDFKTFGIHDFNDTKIKLAKIKK